MADHTPFNETGDEVDRRGQQITYTFSMYLILSESLVVVARTEVTEWVVVMKGIAL